MVLLLVLSVADRLLVGVVERRMTGRLACLGALTGARAVHIHGFPFLTQIATGHVGTVTMTADGVRGASSLAGLAVTFHDLRLPPLSGLVGRPSPTAITVGSVTIRTTFRPDSRGPLLAAVPPRLSGPLTAVDATGRVRRVGVLPGAPPFPIHVDAVRPVPGGLQVTLSASGAALKTAMVRFGSGCASASSASVLTTIGHGAQRVRVTAPAGRDG
ncbi:DUF2993 domain-containing protein [Frankia sp. R82]|uniref:LmeA family phospholipid-binding protein n=1 Tax=Frankia sp. R82 TaxID=2950553 RepID=UPI0020439831|nr:DUF2993 domain-containing protein [Frankia sp. R82]MCM3883728.1 DUF2993 domain-containing protein [Frankia sp. R82]